MDVNRAGLTDLVTGGDGRFLLSSSVPEDLSVEVPLAIKRRGVEAKLVLTQGARHEPDEALIMLIAKTHTVDVVDGGFLWDGAHYRSLSAIAREITGARWSGPRFFGL